MMRSNFRHNVEALPSGGAIEIRQLKISTDDKK